MSKFFSEKFNNLNPYVPGEQPQDKKYIKLNTNESPFPPSPFAQRLAREVVGDLMLYSDPTCSALVKIAAEKFGVNENNILFGNGSDEILDFCFNAFCDKNVGAVFANITYGFYPVFASRNGIPYTEIPLKQDFTIDINDYINVNKTIFIANPNAPTGIALTLNQIEQIVSSNKNNVVVIDEAYVDFGAESAVKLINKYNNLIVTQTFSKSRSLAGARLGLAIACEDLINDLKTIKFSFNPYNVNKTTMYAGIGALIDESYFNKNIQTIIANREYLTKELRNLGFNVLNSKANFVFAKSNKISGEQLYLKLKEQGILVRYFNKELIKDYVRITVGDINQIKSLIKVLGEIL